MDRDMTRRETERAIGWVSALIAANAAGGSIYGLRGAPKVPVEWLQGSPFRDYRVPSLVLGVGVGGAGTVSAVTAWRGSEWTGPAAVTTGAVLTGWIAAQVAIIGPRSFLQPVMVGAGLALIGLGATHRRLAGGDRQRLSN
jgi:hypothetical protein